MTRLDTKILPIGTPLPKGHEKYELEIGGAIVALDNDPSAVSTSYGASLPTKDMPFGGLSLGLLTMADYSAIKLTAPHEITYDALWWFRAWLEKFFKVEQGGLDWVAAAGIKTYDRLCDFYEQRDEESIVQNGVEIHQFRGAQEGHVYLFHMDDVRKLGILIYPELVATDSEAEVGSEPDADQQPGISRSSV